MKLVPASDTKCTGNDVGPCNLVAGLTADFTAVYLSKYMPPEEAPLPKFTDDNLRPPVVSLTQAQMFFASGNLSSFGLVASHSGCGATLSWSTPDGSSARTL